MRISDWSSDVCFPIYLVMFVMIDSLGSFYNNLNMVYMSLMMVAPMVVLMILAMGHMFPSKRANAALVIGSVAIFAGRSEEHTSELQSLMRISYAVFCLKKNKNQNTPHPPYSLAT